METKNWTFRKGSEPHHQALVYDENTGEDIAVTYNDEDGEHARLIASAPELLDALEKFTILNPKHYKDIAGFIINAKEVIAKAANP